jgi:hypothetical protein
MIATNARIKSLHSWHFYRTSGQTLVGPGISKQRLAMGLKSNECIRGITQMTVRRKSNLKIGKCQI